MIDGFPDDEKAERIVTAIRARIQSQSPLLRQMLEVQKRYDGDVVAIPLPDVDGTPTLPKTTPLLIANAIDDVALAASSVRPMVHCPPIDPTKDTGKRSKEFARIRRQALGATYRESNLNILMRRAYRQLAGYATWSMVVVPCANGPRVELREPLATYPDPKAPEDPSPPVDVAFTFLRSSSWLRWKWPFLRKENGGPISQTTGRGDDESWVLFEWLDAEHTIVGLLGPQSQVTSPVVVDNAARPWRIITWDVNPLGYVPAVVPFRASMSRIASQIHQLVGAADLMDKLMALDIAAQEKAIFPDRYVISADGRTARLDGNSWKDGRLGETNIVIDAQTIGELRGQPDRGTRELVDIIQRNIRTSAGTVPQLRGETYGAMRTGRAIDALTGISIDPKVQESHEIAEVALSHVNKAIIDTYKAFWPTRKFTFLTGTQADVAVVEFVPDVHFETNLSAVAYAIPGADATQLTVALAQLQQAGLISKSTARKLHPWISDPEAEEFATTTEAIDEAILQGIMRGVVTSTEPGMSPALIHAARIRELVAQGMSLPKAAEKADDEARKRQAEQPDTDDMGMLGPESMPGLAGMMVPGGGMAPPQPPAPLAPGPQGEEGLAALFGALGAAPPAGVPV